MSTVNAWHWSFCTHREQHSHGSMGVCVYTTCRVSTVTPCGDRSVSG